MSRTSEVELLPGMIRIYHVCTEFLENNWNVTLLLTMKVVAFSSSPNGESEMKWDGDDDKGTGKKMLFVSWMLCFRVQRFLANIISNI